MGCARSIPRWPKPPLRNTRRSRISSRSTTSTAGRRQRRSILATTASLPRRLARCSNRLGRKTNDEGRMIRSSFVLKRCDMQIDSARQLPSFRPPGALAVRAVALTYLSFMLIIPLAVILQDGLRGGIGGLWQAIAQPIARSALLLSLWTALVMALINAVMGTLTAYVLVRYSFPGKRALNAIVDLPFAIPTLVTGVMLVVLYGPQRAVGAWLDQTLGLKIIFAP